MLSLDPAGKIVDVVVLEYKEKRGLPVAKGRFLKQFVGKTMQNKLKLRKDIRGVSGATISSRSMTNGIRKLVYVFNEFYPTQ
jgi:Na+-translocating ferredoxin:NAD+ oxidoreductase RnfG subunit